MAPVCEIFHVRQNGSLAWKWRVIQPNGGAVVVESDKSYPLFYECIIAARESGYQPQIKCK